MSSVRVSERPADRGALTGVWAWHLPEWVLRSTATETRLVRAGALSVSMLAFLVGLADLVTTRLDGLALPTVGVLAVVYLALVAHVARRQQTLDIPSLAVFGACLVAASVLGGAPAYFVPLGMKAIFHHSILSAVVLVALGGPATVLALYHVLERSAAAEDRSIYPLVALPGGLFLVVAAFLVVQLVWRGGQQITAGDGVAIFVRPFLNPALPPYVRQAGLVNAITGTMLLVSLTMIIATPVGVGSGLFISEFASGGLARLLRFCTGALRGISALLLALLAVTVVGLTRDTPLGPFLAGTYVSSGGVTQLAHGSFALAAAVTSLLVVPVVARATEEGCRSLPRGLREGSAALGATDDYTLLHLTLPWAFPNIVTSIVLGCAEVSGGISTILFIGGTGENGVGLFSEVTSLPFAIFFAQYSPFKAYRDATLPYQYAAALALLAIALGLTTVALLLKWRYGRRYARG